VSSGHSGMRITPATVVRNFSGTGFPATVILVEFRVGNGATYDEHDNGEVVRFTCLTEPQKLTSFDEFDSWVRMGLGLVQCSLPSHFQFYKYSHTPCGTVVQMFIIMLTMNVCHNGICLC